MLYDLTFLSRWPQSCADLQWLSLLVLNVHTWETWFLFCCQMFNMDSEDLHSAMQRVDAGDMDAVETLMSMTYHWKNRSFKDGNFRPLTPSSDCSGEDCASTVSTASHDSTWVSDTWIIKWRTYWPPHDLALSPLNALLKGQFHSFHYVHELYMYLI